jgi:hypothetical protein
MLRLRPSSFAASAMLSALSLGCSAKVRITASLCSATPQAASPAISHWRPCMGNELVVDASLRRCHKTGAGIYVFHADTEDANFGRALTDSGLKLSSCCVWVK